MNIDLAHTITIAAGRIRGSTEGGIWSYKNIPFADAPVGPLRWRPPQPAVDWEGVRDCRNFGPGAPQIVPETLSLFGATGDTVQSEDCLQLNIWTPSPDPQAKLPVMVWLHGGGFRTGMASHPMYNGSELAKRGVVVVTINYRLNLFGMYAHPELTKESGNGASGNYSLMDQVAAFRWVRENIATFGGNADNVTAFGESAGARSISTLLTSPLCVGLFDKGICESGAAADVSFSLESRERIGVEIAGRLGADSLDDLREIPVSQMLAELDQLNANPIIDGHVIPEDPVEMYRQGRQQNIPLIVGINGDEGTLFTKLSGASIEAPEGSEDDPDAAARALAKKRFIDPVLDQARCHQAIGADTYLYHFTRVPPYRAGEALGSFHGSEITYVFGGGVRCGLFEPNSPRITDIDRQISNAMMTAWTDFAKFGNPSTASNIWPKFDPTTECYMTFGDTIGATNGFSAETA